MKFDSRISKAVAALALAGCLCASAAGENIVWTPGEGWQEAKKAEGADGYSRALSFLARGKPSKAARLLGNFIKTAREPSREDALVLYAETLMAAGKHPKAYGTFEKFIKEYPNSRHLNRALEGELEIAYALLAGKRIRFLGMRIFRAYSTGEKVVDSIISHRPLSDYARRAQLELARSYYRRKAYLESASAYRQYLELFPNAPEAREAFLGVAESLLSDAQGPRYDPLPYHKVSSVTSFVMREYPQVGSAPRTRTLRRKSRAKLSRHYYLLATWYIKMGKVDAAALYLEKLVAEYPESGWADRAAGLLEILGPRRQDDDAT